MTTDRTTPISDARRAATPETALHRAIPFWSRGFYWHYVAGALVMHAMCLLAPLTFTWRAAGIAFVLYVFTGLIGVCLGYHRYFTHKAFECSQAFEVVMLFFGVLSASGKAVTWVGQHRVHHRWSDQGGDMHSPKHGFSWAHFLWPFVREPNGWSTADFAKDLQRNPRVRFFDRFDWAFLLALVASLFGIGQVVEQNGVGWVVWGMGVRLVCTWHITWLVNSVGHTWGYQNFDTGDDSRNNPIVALLAFGEGWHNNHHASQRCAAHGRQWFELDLTYTLIRVLERLRIARRVIHPGAPLTVESDGVRQKG